MNTDLTIHLFGESIVRNVIKDGEPWFVTKDICAVLNIANHNDAVTSLDDDEKGVGIADTLGGPQQIGIVNESGLYALIFKSRKPEARAFRKWVTSEVLPQIRKRGFYGRREQAVTAFLRELLDMGLDSKDAAKLALASFPPITRHEARIQKLKELNEQNGAGLEHLDEECLHFLSIMQPGGTYGIKDFKAAIPLKHPMLKKSTHSIDSAVGICLQRLVKAEKIRRLPGRYASYQLIVRENVVSMH